MIMKYRLFGCFRFNMHRGKCAYLKTGSGISAFPVLFQTILNAVPWRIM
jgi:hypothetical protein